MTVAGLASLKWGSKLAPPPSLLLTDSLSAFNPRAGGPSATPVLVSGAGAAADAIRAFIPFEQAVSVASADSSYRFPNRTQLLEDAAGSAGAALAEQLVELGEALVARAGSGPAAASYGAALIGEGGAGLEVVVLHNTSAPHAAPLHVNLIVRQPLCSLGPRRPSRPPASLPCSDG